MKIYVTLNWTAYYLCDLNLCHIFYQNLEIVITCLTVKKLKLLANDNNPLWSGLNMYVDRSKENPENFLDGLSITTKSELYGKQGLGFNIIIYESLAGSTRNNLDARFALQK